MTVVLVSDKHQGTWIRRRMGAVEFENVAQRRAPLETVAGRCGGTAGLHADACGGALSETNSSVICDFAIQRNIADGAGLSRCAPLSYPTSWVASALPYSEDFAYKPPCGEIAMRPQVGRVG